MSQLAIRNFNDITGRILSTFGAFYFYVVFFKDQNILSTFLQKANTSFCYSASENLPINVKKVFNVFNLCSLRKNFYVKQNLCYAITYALQTNMEY